MGDHLTVVGDDAWATAAADALASAGHAVVRVADVRAAVADAPGCVVCAADDVAAFARLRARPALVAVAADASCAAALEALERGADECVDRGASAATLGRAAAYALARRRQARRAWRDALTGTADRTLMHERLASAMATIPDGPGALAVLFVDLDGFKAINDRHGHETGDRVLIEVARRLQAGVRPSDLVARYGGDEFVVVCEHVDPAEVRAIVTRLTDRLHHPVALDGGTIPIGASVGAAVTREPSLSAARMIALADADMYRAKAARRPVVAA